MFHIQRTIASNPERKSWLNILPSIFLIISLSAGADTTSLQFITRDFSKNHIDFQQNKLGLDPNIIEENLDADKKPIYAGGTGTITTNGQANFDQWYRNSPGVNLSTSGTLIVDNTITSDPDVYTYSANPFFPIDNQLLGNEGRENNFHFTTELNTSFEYRGGEVLRFSSDDDLWVFINGKLAVDIGGIHTTETREINLDEIATEFGIIPGSTYDFDLFFAERQTTSSVLRFDMPTPAPRILASPENGDSVPTNGSIRVFLVFAEVDFKPCTGNANKAADNWKEGKLPDFKNSLFDHSENVINFPTGFITDYFHQMSFGQYIVLGDYYPELITLNCNSTINANAVMTEIKNTNTEQIQTANKHQLDDFDLWDIDGNRNGQVKPPQADESVDMLLILWRNYSPNCEKEWTIPAGECSGGFITGQTSFSFEDKIGFNNVGQFNDYGGISTGILIHEYMHPVLGGNNWHVGGGAGRHTVHLRQGTYGLLSAFPAVSNVVSGWDRNHIGWQHDEKQFLISSQDETENEMPSDMTIASHPDGGIFVLRDFVENGDAIRIKLPHINWQKLDDNKNQYLWIENHQRISKYDINHEEIKRKDVPCVKEWSPGLYAYIQIGKDTKSSDVNSDGVVDVSDIYPSGNRYPNALASYLFPLTAEGNYDYYYRLDEVDTKGEVCQWVDNLSIPVEQSLSLSNPFTGYSEIYNQIDSDNIFQKNSSGQQEAIQGDPTLIPFGNGRLFSGDANYVLSELIDGQVVKEIPQFGDDQDAFSFKTGNTKLSIGTNPAPVPVYTNTSNNWFSGLTPASLTGASYENRTIWLNGLSIEILDEININNSSDKKVIVVQVRWDDYLIENDVRWTGNIVLQNDDNDPLKRKSRIILAEGKNLYLDRGLSPTQDIANLAAETIEIPTNGGSIYPSGLGVESGRLFTEPTHLLVKAGTKLHLERNSTLWLLNKSTLEVEAGAEVHLEPGASIQVGVGSSENNKKINGVVRNFGDLDNPPDGCVDRNDLRTLLTVIRSKNGSVFYDLNEDNKIDIADARKLVNYFSNSRGKSCP